MQYRRLGASGLVVSRLALGMMSFGDRSRRAWHLDADQAEPIVREAVEAGVTLFDTADMYDNGESERVTGQLLRKLVGSRDDYVLATKCYYPTGAAPTDRGLSRKHVLAAVDASLRRLGTDHVDLLQIHRWDPETPIEETLRALDDVVRAGKVRYLGASSMYAWQFATARLIARAAGWTEFVSMQNLYNLAYREEEREMIPYCLQAGVGVLPYSPLARGLLSGSRGADGTRTTSRGGHDPLADDQYDAADFAVVDAVRAVADERGVPPARVALAWVAGRPGVTAPIVGATRRDHVRDAVAALELALEPGELARLEAPYRTHPVLGLEPDPAPVPASVVSR